MGNNFTSEIKVCIRQDNSSKLLELIEKNNIPLNYEIGNPKRTLIIYSILYHSPNCLQSLINLGNDYNIPDKQDQSSPLFLASKFNYVNLIKILLNQKDIKIASLNNIGLNALDVSIIRGNYESSLYLINNTILKPEKSLESYKILNKQLEYPLFNIDLFYETLMKKIDLEKIPNFALPKKRLIQFKNKVPDPNESWTNFIKRLGRFELYQPPLIDNNKVGKMNSLYMKMQSKLIEEEYDVKIDLSGNNFINNNNVENNLTNNNLLEDNYNKIDFESCAFNEKNDDDKKNKIIQHLISTEKDNLNTKNNEESMKIKEEKIN
jgi:hypothetical protein